MPDHHQRRHHELHHLVSPELSCDPASPSSRLKVAPFPLTTALPPGKTDGLHGRQSNGRRCSVVMPDGPAAAPLLTDGRLRLNWCSSNLNALWGMCVMTLSARACGGHLVSGCQLSALKSLLADDKFSSKRDQHLCSEGTAFQIILIPSTSSPSCTGSLVHRITRSRQPD